MTEKRMPVAERQQETRSGWPVLCQLLEAGLLRASFISPKPIRTLRNLTRYRKTQINDRQRESSRLHKILEDTGIKLSCVASDHGNSRLMALGSRSLRRQRHRARMRGT
jgi:hypothetical protein